MRQMLRIGRRLSYSDFYDSMTTSTTASTVEERPGEAGFTMLLEPANEAPAKAGFGGAVLHLLLGKQNRSRVKAVLDGSRFEPRGSTGRYWRVHACPRESLRVHLEGGSTRVPRGSILQ